MKSYQATVLGLWLYYLQRILVFGVEVVFMHNLLTEKLLFFVLISLMVLFQFPSSLDRKGKHLGQRSSAEGEVFSTDCQILGYQRTTLIALIHAFLKSWGLNLS